VFSGVFGAFHAKRVIRVFGAIRVIRAILACWRAIHANLCAIRANPRQSKTTLFQLNLIAIKPDRLYHKTLHWYRNFHNFTNKNKDF